ncbi:L,D-transpeptidase family protein [Streptomyces sp. NPDC007088]|uniref:L,D-transpeptidase family protein n=1 Tax=Streptomyces sp. NPDC007088 TaxID=3364773 RepID=UPI0036A25CEB
MRTQGHPGARGLRRTVLVGAQVLLLVGCAGTRAAPEHASPTPDRTVPGAASGASGASGQRAVPAAGPEAAEGAARIPALGPRTRARLPAGTRQALVVTGRSADSNRASAVLYERGGAKGWRPVAGPWPARNALLGWTTYHRVDDLRSPSGVYTLTDAGGRDPDPGTRLPYDRDPVYGDSGTGFEGEPLDGSFDHVVAIDYNRVPGSPPRDRRRPMGAGRGGGIWLHVDHGGPTQGCVSLTKPRLRTLMRRLNPALHPVVVMGAAPMLAK